MGSNEDSLLDHGGNIDHVWLEPSVPDRILRNELEQRGISKIVAAVERYALAHNARVHAEVASQPIDVCVVDQFQRQSEDRIIDAFMLRQINIAGARNMSPQAWPTRESVLAGDGEIGIRQVESRRLYV
jgi:hypothetical protein